jgi:hypothetical protein
MGMEISYSELYISKSKIYTITDAGLTYIKDYEIDMNSILILDGILNNYNPTIKIDSDKLIFNYADSTQAIYVKINKGILPEAYIKNQLDDKYWRDFYKREKVFQKTKKIEFIEGNSNSR